jgi:hypothetical protein
MIRALAYLGLVVLAGPVLASDTPPSGLHAELHETIFEPAGVTAATAKRMRLRYHAPEISDQSAFGFEVIEADFRWLCERDGVKFAAVSAPMVKEVVVSIASEIVAFGETAPSVVQYFDAFRIDGAACIWEGL